MNKEETLKLKRRVNLGCGPIIIDGFLRVDTNSEINPDIIQDLSLTPWSLPSNYFIEIMSSHCIEHLPDLEVFLNEVYRIAKDGCIFRFEYPHYSLGYSCPLHLRAYGLEMLGHRTEFNVLRVRLEWSRHASRKSFSHQILNKIINRIANLKPYWSERIFCYWVGGFDNVILEGKINKKNSPQIKRYLG